MLLPDPQLHPPSLHQMLLLPIGYGFLYVLPYTACSVQVFRLLHQSVSLNHHELNRIHPGIPVQQFSYK